jgi:hypothetical protein
VPEFPPFPGTGRASFLLLTGTSLSYSIEGPLLCYPGPSRSRLYEDDSPKSFLQKLFEEIPGLREYYAGEDDPPNSLGFVAIESEVGPADTAPSFNL